LVVEDKGLGGVCEEGLGDELCAQEGVGHLVAIDI
jgi:hypothetical protein